RWRRVVDGRRALSGGEELGAVVALRPGRERLWRTRARTRRRRGLRPALAEARARDLRLGPFDERHRHGTDALARGVFVHEEHGDAVGHREILLGALGEDLAHVPDPDRHRDPRTRLVASEASRQVVAYPHAR